MTVEHTCGLCMRRGARGFDLYFDHSPLYRCKARRACLTRRRELAQKDPARLLAGRIVLGLDEVTELGAKVLRLRLDRGLTVYTGGVNGVNWTLQVSEVVPCG